MEKQLVVTKRFQKNSLSVYNYLLKNFSSKTAFEFLTRLEKRINFIARNPEIGKPSVKRVNVRSIILVPHKHIYYRVTKSKIELLGLFDMRRNPNKRPY